MNNRAECYWIFVERANKLASYEKINCAMIINEIPKITDFLLPKYLSHIYPPTICRIYVEPKAIPNR